MLYSAYERPCERSRCYAGANSERLRSAWIGLSFGRLVVIPPERRGPSAAHPT